MQLYVYDTQNEVKHRMEPFGRNPYLGGVAIWLQPWRVLGTTSVNADLSLLTQTSTDVDVAISFCGQ